jgi:hypothetical protein
VEANSPDCAHELHWPLQGSRPTTPQSTAPNNYSEHLFRAPISSNHPEYLELDVFRPRPARKSDLATASLRFALYVEGPRDRDVLRLFAQKLSPELARVMDPCVRILGGRQPDRAARLFGSMIEQAAANDSGTPRGICVLDRDDPRRYNQKSEAGSGERAGAAVEADPHRHSSAGGPSPASKLPRLEFVVWNRRQIESYLMVPPAIRRCIAKDRADPRDDSRIDRMLETWLPDPGNEDAFRKLDAKKVLGHRGPIANFLGRPLRAQEIVRSMTPLDIHSDVKDVLARVRDQLASPIESSESSESNLKSNSSLKSKPERSSG